MANLVLLGTVLQGCDRAEVIRRLSAALKMPEDRAGALLDGQRRVIKKDLSDDDADRYLAALQKTGAELEIAEQVSEAGEAQQAGTGLGLCPPQTAVLETSERQAFVPKNIDLSALSLAAVGERLPQAPPTPPSVQAPDLDIEPAD